MQDSSASESVNTLNKSINSIQDTKIENGNTSVKKFVKLDVRARLLELTGQLEQKTSTSKFMKISAGQTKILEFDPEKVDYVTITYPNKEGEPPNNPVNQVKFLFREANVDGLVREGSDWIEWTTSQTTAKMVIALLLKGFFKLEISRDGHTKQDTRYMVTPFV